MRQAAAQEAGGRVGQVPMTGLWPSTKFSSNYFSVRACNSYWPEMRPCGGGAFRRTRMKRMGTTMAMTRMGIGQTTGAQRMEVSPHKRVVMPGQVGVGGAARADPVAGDGARWRDSEVFRRSFTSSSLGWAGCHLTQCMAMWGTTSWVAIWTA